MTTEDAFAGTVAVTSLIYARELFLMYPPNTALVYIEGVISAGVDDLGLTPEIISDLESSARSIAREAGKV